MKTNTKVALIASTASLAAVIVVILLFVIIKYFLWKDVVSAVKTAVFDSVSGSSPDKNTDMTNITPGIRFDSSHVVETKPTDMLLIKNNAIDLIHLIEAVTRFQSRGCSKKHKSEVKKHASSSRDESMQSATHKLLTMFAADAASLAPLKPPAPSCNMDPKGTAKPSAAAMPLPEQFQLVQVSPDALMLIALHPVSGSLYVAFRGTKTRKEWSKVLDYRRDGCKIPGLSTQLELHSGFQSIYLPLRSTILQSLNQFQPRHVYIGGYSLGSALASLAAADIMENHSKNHPCTLHVYTIASPRVGGPLFAQYLENAIHRQDSSKTSTNIEEWVKLTNESDVICSIPCSVMPDLLHLPRAGKKKKRNMSLAFEHVSPTVSIVFNKNQGTWSANHSLSEYLGHLQK